MKSKNKILHLLIASSLLAASVPALALTGDTDQPINITSDKQALDMTGNTATFTDNVIVKQGSIEIKADRMVISRPGGDQSKTVIEGFGNPVTFYQMQDNGKPVKGHGQKLRYEVAKEFVILTGDAYLEQLDSNIKGDKITYLVKEQQMEAFSDKGKRVTTVLLPSQLQDKGPNATGQKKSK
ncbi:lipopolysaccharide ABC transporter substrate-binding protein LptA [Yersinia ruckeri]|uniref:Lipopolysaccharide export system protein LptA n=1 Tax=Yersinia ruckeri TaxID=29486 RepID=A0A085UAR8_YERRU|nr:lipopolysaccharide ABC transporter substrate-binding protein LptA [Yersinia ruckeri]AKA38362.1 lipopolysaccharide transporter [Yersinia ruckeri]ARY99765.1 lipopolysaccharide transport periplasmic protein LptA [Yersinia ruckeri]AUQ41892.1 lipopolysaccharide ABC transporter substrate-binding protein LptA [Yersinia ruckeri]EKN3346046.1 lipopolysaccharide ABC transporter substrate-binding protein LptA [Yersinia ruckeri]EKN3362247.1 lipopolysaccharide ABC transporter substrate-binding protein Lp